MKFLGTVFMLTSLLTSRIGISTISSSQNLRYILLLLFNFLMLATSLYHRISNSGYYWVCSMVVEGIISNSSPLSMIQLFP
jgi:hypothetical protein